MDTNVCENAKIKYVQYINNTNAKVVIKICFEISKNRVIFTKDFVLNGEKIKNILDVLEVGNWEKLPKKYARIKIRNNIVESIGNIINEKWFILN